MLKHQLVEAVLRCEAFAVGWIGFARTSFAELGSKLLLPFFDGPLKCKGSPALLVSRVDDYVATMRERAERVKPQPFQATILAVLAQMMDAGADASLVGKVHGLLPAGPFEAPFCTRLSAFLRFCPKHGLEQQQQQQEQQQQQQPACRACAHCIRHTGVRKLECEELTAICRRIGSETDVRRFVVDLVRRVPALPREFEALRPTVVPALHEDSPVADDAACLLAVLWENALARAVGDTIDNEVLRAAWLGVCVVFRVCSALCAGRALSVLVCLLTKWFVCVVC